MDLCLRALLLLGRRDNEAEPLCRRALDISEQIYGLNHPKVATCLNNLATQASKQARRPLLLLPRRRQLRQHTCISVLFDNLSVFNFRSWRCRVCVPFAVSYAISCIVFFLQRCPLYLFVRCTPFFRSTLSSLLYLFCCIPIVHLVKSRAFSSVSISNSSSSNAEREVCI